jgi:hypothetical protein
MQTLDLGQMQQCGWIGTTWQGESAINQGRDQLEMNQHGS